MRKPGVTVIALFLVLSVAGCQINIPGPGNRENSSSPVTTAIPIQPGWTPAAINGGIALPNIADVVPLITPSVVSIQTEAIAYDVFLRPFPGQGAGTGIIVDPNGYILTNSHVVEDATKVTVTLEDGRSFDATDVRRDPQTDIAVIKVNAQGLPSARIGDSKRLRVGDWVIAVGNALALEGGPTVTKGIVSYLGRSILEENGNVLYDLIQTDTPINPGNSGGPLVNMAGEVVGINTAIAGEAQNIGFAISINPAMAIVQPLVDKGYVPRPFLGVRMQTVNPALARQYDLAVNKGVLLTSVDRGTPADKAGLRPGDVVVRFGGIQVDTVSTMRQVLYSRKAGDAVEIVYQRGPAQQTTTATLSESPPPG